ncbi:MAG: Spy/CpxP family protein refolding chaperone [Pseudobdellovibrionaceae bacterium]
MKSSIRYFLMALCLFSVVNCASKPTQEEVKVQQEVQAEPPRKMHGEVAQKGFESIVQSKSLTDDQKAKLLKLHTKMSAETSQIQDETSKLKAVLFDTMTAKPYDSKKVNVIKKRLITLNDKKMKNMLKAIDEVKDIVGQTEKENIQDFYRPFFWEQAHEELR